MNMPLRRSVSGPEYSNPFLHHSMSPDGRWRDRQVVQHHDAPLRVPHHDAASASVPTQPDPVSNTPTSELFISDFESAIESAREIPVSCGLFLPESWTSKPARLKRAGVPAEYRTARTKPEMALAELDSVIAAGVRFGCVLADAGYGMSAPFRQGLTARNLAWAVGVPRHLKAYPADVQMIWPVAKRGRPRRRHIPDVLSVPAEDMLANAAWRTISWRTGTKGKLKARFAAVRVRVADGPPQRIRDKGQQHLPGDEAWLIGEHRMSGEKKYYVANLPAKTNLRTLAVTIKARWICEQAHQQLKEELGLDHFEGRSWQGLHRHALMTMIAYAFLQYRRLARARREKKKQRAAAAANFARRTPRHPQTVRSTTAAMPALSKTDL